MPCDDTGEEQYGQQPQQPLGPVAEDKRTQRSANDREGWTDADDGHAVARMQETRITTDARGSGS